MAGCFFSRKCAIEKEYQLLERIDQDLNLDPDLF
jgi:hypothetical protein